MSKLIAVIAGNFGQFEFHARAKGLKRIRTNEAEGADGMIYRYVSEPHQVFGIRWDGIEKWGTWYDNEHSHDLLEEISHRLHPVSSPENTEQ